jgi:hypothetical protein
MPLDNTRYERTIHGVRITATGEREESGETSLVLDGAEIVDADAFCEWFKDQLDVMYPPKGCAGPWIERED